MIFWHALRRYLRGDSVAYAGYLAFLTLLALLPLMAVLFWLAQQSSIISTAEVAVRDFLYRNLFAETADRVVHVVERLRTNARGLGMMGIVIILLDLALKALALNTAFDRLWDGVKRPWHSFIRSVVTLLVIVPTAVGALVWLIRLIGKTVDAWLPAVSTKTLAILFDPLETGLPLVLALYLIYRWVPARVQSRRAAVWAALLVTVLIEIARYLIAQYFAQMQQLKSLYGAFIALPVIMMTAFVLWSLVLYGAALVAEGWGRRSNASTQAAKRLT